MIVKANSYTNDINRIIEFRQDVYNHVLTGYRDTLFELIDAILLSDSVRSFAELSLSPAFRRKWASIYKAVEEGEIDEEWLRRHLSRQLPRDNELIFALDGTAWRHPQAKTLKDRQYVYSPTPAVDGGSIVIGHPYSLLAWVVEKGSSWALPMSCERIKSESDAVEVGVEQIKELCENRPDHLEDCLYVVTGDGKYGNSRFLRELRDLDTRSLGLLVRMRRDRVLYGTPSPREPGKRGRPNKHGERFVFKEPGTQENPDGEVELTDEKWGKVRIRLWKNLHGKEDAETTFTVVQICAHLERERPPKPLWLAWHGPPVEDISCFLNWYAHRWPIEPAIRFRKQDLYWTLPRFQSVDSNDRWTTLVSIGQWQLFLAREVVQDNPLPWQPKQVGSLTPGRVKKGLGALFAQIGSPSAPVKSRGKSPGWPKGRRRSPPVRHKVVKKAKKKRKAA